MQFDLSRAESVFVAAFDGYYVIGLVCFRQAGAEESIQYFSLFTHLGTDKYQRSATEFPPLAHPTHTYGRYDFFSGKQLQGKSVNTQFLEKFLVLGQEILVLSIRATVFLHRGWWPAYICGHVTALIGSDGYKQVSISSPHFFFNP